MQPDIYARRMRAYQLFFAAGSSALPPAIDLVRPGELLTPLTLTRTQASSFVTAVGTDDTTLDFYAANVARFQGSARRLLVEGTRSNLFLNSATGATQNVTTTAVSHTLSFYGTGTITLTGTSTAGPLVGTGANNRVSLTFTPTAGTLTLTVTGSCTQVQLETGTFASSYMETAGASVSRGNDLVSCTLSSIGVRPSGACTVLWRGMIPQNAPTGVAQIVFRLDDGGASNAYTFRNDAASATFTAVRVNGGAVASSTAVGPMTAGTAFNFGATIDGVGGASVSFNGGAVQSVSGGPTSGLTSFRLGASFDGSFAMFGETQTLRILPYAVSTSTLQSLVSALS